jgi:Zn-dependent peptidase ImmA (M78 family)/DNA-binding XRE family transcriptional regulator
MTNGRRIRQARELCGFSQEELARRASIAQPTIAQFERGLREPSDETLRVLAFQLGFPPSFFREMSASEFPLGTHVLYRTRASQQTRADKVKAHRYAETVFQGIEKLGESVELIKPTIPQVRDEPAAAAKLTRAQLGLAPDVPVGNLVRTLERAGVVIIPLVLPIQNPDAFSVWAGIEGNVPVIALLTGRPGDRIRMTVAHDCGHLVLHRPLRVTPSEAEREAREFAAELLMPIETILPELRECESLEEFAQLKLRWKVSIQALIVRSHEFGIISDRRYQRLFQRLSALGMRQDEPHKITEERPRVFRKMAEITFGNPIDYTRMASKLGWQKSFCKMVVEAHAGPDGSFSDPAADDTNGKAKPIQFPGGPRTDF